MEEYKKVTISFTKDQLEKLDEIMSKEQGYSRSSLVREAVDYYLGYLAQKGSVSYLSPIISQNIKLVLSRFEENLSEMLFKLAVEVSKSNILSARNCELNDYALNYMNFNAPVALNNARIGFLFSMLAKQIVNSAGKRLYELNKMMPLTDSKERAKIREKKLAHGQKEGADGYGTDDEDYDSQAAEGILTMLDYLISLGDQESEQVNDEQNTQTADEFNFDNAYAEYLNDEDDDLDDEDDEEYFGLSM